MAHLTLNTTRIKLFFLLGAFVFQSAYSDANTPPQIPTKNYATFLHAVSSGFLGISYLTLGASLWGMKNLWDSAKSKYQELKNEHVQAVKAAKGDEDIQKAIESHDKQFSWLAASKFYVAAYILTPLVTISALSAYLLHKTRPYTKGFATYAPADHIFTRANPQYPHLGVPVTGGDGDDHQQFNVLPFSRVVQAWEELNLPLGANKDMATAARRTSMTTAHPDKGGNGDRAASINAAKETIDQFWDHPETVSFGI